MSVCSRVSLPTFILFSMRVCYISFAIDRSCCFESIGSSPPLRFNMNLFTWTYFSFCWSHRILTVGEVSSVRCRCTGTPVKMQVVFVRHGHCYPGMVESMSVEERSPLYDQACDPPLTEEGVKQAKGVSFEGSHEDGSPVFDCVLSSTMQRCKDTMRHALQAGRLVGKRILVTSLLRERVCHRCDIMQIEEDLSSDKIPSESFEAMAKRAARFRLLLAELKEGGATKVCVFGHSSYILRFLEGRMDRKLNYCETFTMKI